MTAPQKLTLGAVLIAPALAAVAMLQPAPPARAIDAPRTITLLEPFEGGKSSSIDVGKRGPSAGDMAFVTDVPLSDESGARAGSVDGTETFLSRRHHGTVQLAGTIRLADGTISVGAIQRHDQPDVMPVLGGTGAYAGVRGTMSTREDTRRKVNVIRLELLP